ncbi:MAG TPA: hypothetical protein VL382_09780 [Terriglobales bacterium]|nr:hypothetical protein [Terriglobales bacterium]
MDRVRFITHQGKQVLLLDYHNLADEAEMLEMIDERKELVNAQPKGSVLTIADVTNARFSKNVLTRIKEANVLDLPFVRRSALVGVDPSQEAAVQAVDTFAHRHWKRFATVAEALDWIVSDEAEAEGRAR